MTIFLSLGLFIVVYLGLVYLVFHLRKNSAIVPLVLAYPAFICLESLLLNVLSMFHAVTSQWLIGAHLLFCLGVVIHMGANRRVAGNLWFRLSSRVRQLFRKASPPFILMLPLLFIICLTAFLYVPNNYDSMTYHLARVAHWIQNQSVGYYLTHISRQNQMGPGAEYLILFFQIISGSDRLANTVQFFSYLLIPIGLYYLMRVIRIDRKTIPWVIVLCLTTPMAVLQASSTQNDLVDSLLALSIILAGARLLVGNAMRMQRNDIILAAMCCSAGYLVKPISLIVIFPIIVTSCLLQCRKMFHLLKSPRGYHGLLASLILIAIICGPDIVRKVSEGGFSRSEVYPLLSGWDATRFYNPLALLAPNFPYSTVFNEFVRNFALPVQPFNRNVFYVHEDFIGNPVQLLLLFIPALCAAAFLPFGLISGSRKRLALLLLALLPLTSWCTFAWIVKNQAWITRLQLPLFFLLPFSLALFFSRWVNRGSVCLRYFMLIVVSLFSYSYAMKIVSMNPTRPLEIRFFWGGVPTASENYYRNFNKIKEHNNFLRVAQEQNCRQAYLLLSGDYPEYPLTWRAMQAGIRMRHAYREDVDAWPCMLFADTVESEPSYVPERGVRWVEAGESHTLIRNLKYEFELSSKVVAKVDSWPKELDLNHSAGPIELDYQGGQLLIIAGDTDPYIIMPVLSGDLGEGSVIRIAMKSPVQTVFKLYYQTKKNEEYSEKNVFRKTINPGSNVIDFQVPGDISLSSLRIDPGQRPATYSVQNVEIRRIVAH